MHHEDSLYVRPFVERDDPPQRVYEFQAGAEGLPEGLPGSLQPATGDPVAGKVFPSRA
jgi:hypothetical protein